MPAGAPIKAFLISQWGPLRSSQHSPGRNTQESLTRAHLNLRRPESPELGLLTHNILIHKRQPIHSPAGYLRALGEDKLHLTHPVEPQKMLVGYCLHIQRASHSFNGDHSLGTYCGSCPM